MPLTKFQVVFGIDNRVELLILIDGVMQSTLVDLTGAPFAKSMLGDPDVKDALRAWMLPTGGPSWMSWTDVEAALVSAGLSFDHMVATYPATSVG